jgi:hypothetical protein
MASGQASGGGGSKLFFHEGQKEAANTAIAEFFRRFQSGAPTAIQGIQAKRAQDRVMAQTAQAGFSASDPITQKRLQSLEVQNAINEESSIMDIVKMFITPAGSQGATSSSVGFGLGNIKGGGGG